jgi:Arc/MetJ-type ribon-helix-helix transcriptional regulator
MTGPPLDLAQVRHCFARLDALLAAHPELQSPDAQARLTAWLQEEQQRTMDRHKEKQVYIRLPDAVVAEIDRYAERLARTQPGLDPSRSDVIRVLIYKGLEAMHAETAAPGSATDRAERGAKA